MQPAPTAVDRLVSRWGSLRALYHVDLAGEGHAADRAPALAEAEAALEKSLVEISRAVSLEAQGPDVGRSVQAGQIRSARRSLALASFMVQRAQDVAQAARDARERARAMRQHSVAQRERQRSPYGK